MSASPARAAVMWNQIGTLLSLFAKSSLKFPLQSANSEAHKEHRITMRTGHNERSDSVSEQRQKRTLMSHT